MKEKSIYTKKESIKKSYTKPMLEELGDVSGLTRGSGGNDVDTGGLTTPATRPMSLTGG